MKTAITLILIFFTVTVFSQSTTTLEFATKTDTTAEIVYLPDSSGVLRQKKVYKITVKYRNGPPFSEYIDYWYINPVTKERINKRDATMENNSYSGTVKWN